MNPQSQTRPGSDERRQLDRVRRELLSEFGGRLPLGELDARFAAIVQEFDEAPVRAFIPVLARRRARQLLQGPLG